MPQKIPRVEPPNPTIWSGLIFTIVFLTFVVYFVMQQFSQNTTRDMTKEVDALFKTGAYVEAEKVCEQALQRVPIKNIVGAQDYSAGNNERMALILCKEDRKEEALSYFKESIKLHLASFLYHKTHYGNVNANYNSYSEAIAIGRVVFNYGQLLVALDSPKEASDMASSTWLAVLSDIKDEHEQATVLENALDRMVQFIPENNFPEGQETLSESLIRLRAKPQNDDQRIKEYLLLMAKNVMTPHTPMYLNYYIFSHPN